MAKDLKVGDWGGVGMGGGRVSRNVKLVKPGSKPRTQSNTEKATIKAKAEQKTPAKRAAARASVKQQKVEQKRETRNRRNYVLNNVREEALENAGYKLGGLNRSNPTAAQTKAANKAVAEAQVAMKNARLKKKSK